MRILVADDDPVLRQLLVAQLALDGHVVDTVEDGTAALAAVDADPPDLVLLDVMMPGLSGWDVLERLRAQPEHRALPVLLLTARDLPHDRQRGYELGASAVLSKTHDVAMLGDTVRAFAVSVTSRS